MLHHLHIKNLAVLEDAHIDFASGFNVLPGETGAGKSIVVDSLALLSGARAQVDLIRSGTDVMEVTGVFDSNIEALVEILTETGIDHDDDEIVVRREVHRTGRNQVFVNDRPVTLRLLSRLAPHLLRIHGQREELGLAQPQLQRAWLDRQGGEEAETLLDELRQRYDSFRKAAARRDRLTTDRRLRDERVDLLRYQIDEIDEADVSDGEEVELREERGVLRNAQAIAGALTTLVERLFDDEGSATERLGVAANRLQEIEEWEPEARNWRAELDEARIRLEELVASVRPRAEGVGPDPNRLQEIEDRLALLERLFRKYGESARALLDYRARVGEELAELLQDDENREGLEVEVTAALSSYREAARVISQRRREWSRKLVEQLVVELRELSMPTARFEIELEPRSRDDSPLEVDGRRVDFGPTGHDQVTYFFSPNPGEETRPLSKVASGGELSRVYLALQLQVMAEDAPSLVFDEIDSGVGGVEASALGRKLKTLAEHGQILTVTHLPQVASQGDVHYNVAKEVRDGRTFVSVARLDGEERISEISRMLGDETPTAASRTHALELLESGAATTVR